MRILMRAAAGVVTIAAVLSVGTANPVAQNDRPNPQATRQTPPPPVVAPPMIYRANEQRDVTAARRDQQNAFTCTVPDSDARFNVDSVMTYRGQSYRCVEVYASDKPSPGAAILRFSSMGWIKEGAAPGR